MNEHLIQTGRTTRQMREALDYARAGHKVRFVVETRGFIREASRRLDVLNGGPSFVEVVSMVDIDKPDNLFNWSTLRPFNSHPANIFILDHSVVEAHYLKLSQQVAAMQTLMVQLYPLTTGALRGATKARQE